MHPQVLWLAFLDEFPSHPVGADLTQQPVNSAPWTGGCTSPKAVRKGSTGPAVTSSWAPALGTRHHCARAQDSQTGVLTDCQHQQRGTQVSRPGGAPVPAPAWLHPHWRRSRKLPPVLVNPQVSEDDDNKTVVTALSYTETDDYSLCTSIDLRKCIHTHVPVKHIHISKYTYTHRYATVQGGRGTNIQQNVTRSYSWVICFPYFYISINYYTI